MLARIRSAAASGMSWRRLSRIEKKSEHVAISVVSKKALLPVAVDGDPFGAGVGKYRLGSDGAQQDAMSRYSIGRYTSAPEASFGEDRRDRPALP